MTSLGLETLDQRMERASRFLPFFLLGISVLLTTLMDPHWGSLRITLGVSALAAVWTLCLVTLRPVWASQVLMGIYFAGFLVFGAVLVVRSAWFGFYAFTGVLHAFQFFRGGWRYAGIAATAVLSAICSTGGIRKASGGEIALVAVVTVFDFALYAGFGMIGQRTDEQNRRRREVIEQLAEANHRLEQSLREKAGLRDQLVTQAREAGVSAERQRMAREIHDTLAQGLTGIITQLQAAQRAIPAAMKADPAAAWSRHLDTAAQLARDSLAEARRSVGAMRPAQLEDARLPDALAGVAGKWSAIHDVKTEVTTTGEARPLHPEIEMTLLRVAQEALANVGKHAEASRVALTLSYMEDVVTLDVRDDGRGFTPAGVTPNGHGGFGLTGMRQRLGNVAGSLAIESEPGGGTAISACVPAIAVGHVSGQEGTAVGHVSGQEGTAVGHVSGQEGTGRGRD
jgi:signal transduction histidine kinase